MKGDINPIDWNQIPSMVKKIRNISSTAKRLASAYQGSQVKVQNRINILRKLSNDIFAQSSNINRELDIHLSYLRRIRSQELSEEKRIARENKKQSASAKLDRSGKRKANRSVSPQGS